MGKTKKTLGDRSFQIGPNAQWNSLPASVRDIDNFLVFKRTIKTNLQRLFRVIVRLINFRLQILGILKYTVL